MRPAAALASEGIDMPLVIWFTIHLVLRSAACVGEVALTRPGDIKVVGALSLSPQRTPTSQDGRHCPFKRLRECLSSLIYEYMEILLTPPKGSTASGRRRSDLPPSYETVEAEPHGTDPVNLTLASLPDLNPT